MAIWYASYPGDFMKSTMLLPLESIGAYRVLIDFYYQNESPIPNDRFKIAKILRVSPQKAKKIMEDISHLFEEKNGFLVNKRVELEIRKILKKQETAQANGRAGGVASAKAKAAPSHIHSQNNNKRDSRKVDIKFYPDQETQEFLKFRKIIFNRNNVDTFIQYYTAKDNRCGNWQAKFKQWMLKEKTFNKTRGDNNGTHKTSSAKVLSESCSSAFEDT